MTRTTTRLIEDLRDPANDDAWSGFARTLGCSHGGAEVLTAGFDGAVLAWRWGGSPARTIATGLPPLWSARYAPDGRSIAVGARGGLVYLWRSDEPDRAVVLDCKVERVAMLAISLDGDSLACAASGGPSVQTVPAAYHSRENGVSEGRLIAMDRGLVHQESSDE